MSEQKPSVDYLASRNEWLERYGSYIARARNWRFAAIGFAISNIILAFGFVHEADLVKVVPYVVEVDRLGQDVRLAQAVQSGAFQGNNVIVRYVLSAWVNEVFSRMPDNGAEERQVLKTYDFVTDDAARVLNAYFKAHNPYGQKGFRQVKVISCLPMAGTRNVWQVTWEATQYGDPKSGDPIEWQKRYSATLQIAITPPADAKLAEANPFGIYITNFTYQETL